MHADLTDISDDQIRLFVGPHAEYYLKSWKKMDEKKRKSSGNLSIFLVSLISPVFWLFYRKIYKIAFIYLGILALVGCFEEYVLKSGPTVRLSSTVNFLATIFFTIRGNYVYRCHVYNKISNILSTFNRDHVNSEIAKQGRTNIFIVFVIVLLLFGGISLSILSRHIK